MATEHEKEVLIESLKGTRRIDFKELISNRQDELHKLKKSWLGREQTATQEKFFTAAEADLKKMEILLDELIKETFPEEKDSWRYNYTVTVLVSKDKH